MMLFLKTRICESILSHTVNVTPGFDGQLQAVDATLDKWEKYIEKLDVILLRVAKGQLELTEPPYYGRYDTKWVEWIDEMYNIEPEITGAESNAVEIDS